MPGWPVARRHGRELGQAEGAHACHSPWPLTALGRESTLARYESDSLRAPSQPYHTKLNDQHTGVRRARVRVTRTL
jgi:hypothetical protein